MNVGESFNSSPDRKSIGSLNTSQMSNVSRIDIKSNFYISKLAKVDDTDQLLQALFIVAGKLSIILNLIYYCRKLSKRLSKSRH